MTVEGENERMTKLEQETLGSDVVAFAPRYLDRVSATVFGWAPVSPSEPILMTTPVASREQLAALRDTYLRALLGRAGASERVSLLQEVERAARPCISVSGAGAALAFERLDAASRKLREGAKNKLDSLSLWAALDALAADLRSDRAAVDALQRDHDFDTFAMEVAENVQAISASLYGLAQASDTQGATLQVLEAVRGAFGWGLATYWRINPAESAMALALVSGDLSNTLRSSLDKTVPTKGDELFGRAWKRGDVTDIKITKNAQLGSSMSVLGEAGIRTLVSFPVMVGQESVAGVVAFLITQELELSETRRDLLRNIAVLLSSSFERMAQVEQMRDLAASVEGVNQVLRRVNAANTSLDATRTAVDSIKEAFGGVYAACWATSADGSSMQMAAESGETTHAFRTTTNNARYTQGAGVVGRAWLERDLVVVADMAREDGELRRASALEAGVRCGACFPLIGKGRVVGAIEVWFGETTSLSRGRIDALRSVGSAVSSTLERLTERDGFAASLEDFAKELLAVSSSLRATTAEQSASAQELASAIGQVTATLSELRETSSEALRNAESVIFKAEGALATSASGRSSVERAIESMRVIREQVSEIAERILQLNDQTSQIGSIIATVNEISAQSKLLALNAAIEAARAGEHGKGFGVVASEIRSLAEQSKEATGQVREILSEIQASTNAAVVAAEEGTKKSESGMALADTSGERIQELARSMEESSSSARLIANSARQQSAGIEQVAQALVSISNATNDTASGLKQTEQATQQLLTLAERMANIVRGVAPRIPANYSRPSNQNAAE